MTLMWSEKQHTRQRSTESGYVAAMTALMLIPMMIMAALAIDIGSWYSVAASTQTAADAAALAAVSHLPNLDAAVQAAFEEAARNGVVDADGHSQSTFDIPTSYPQILVSLPSSYEVQVDIITEADALFGQVVLEGVIINRRARAQFVRPVPMGNPTSQLGAGHLLSPPDYSSAYWLNVGGYCGRRADGTRSFSGYENDATGCSGSPAGADNVYLAPYSYSPGFTWGTGFATEWTGINTSLDPVNEPWYEGNTLRDDYFVAIELSEAIATQQYRVQIYRPGTCIASLESYFSPTHLLQEQFLNGRKTLTGPRIHTRLFNVDVTLANRWDAVNAGNIRADDYWELDDCDGDFGDGWYTISVIGGTASEAGTHYLSYGSEENVNEIWTNVFALRVVPAASNSVCSDLSRSGGCPTISAVDDLPIFISDFDEAGNPVPPAAVVDRSVNVYLGHVPEEHAGKTLEIKLFDAGEGMDYLQILDPSDTPQELTWKSAACQDTGFCEGTNDDGTVSGADNLVGGTGQDASCPDKPCLSVTGSKFQNNEVTIKVDVPPGYTCSANCWWKVRYVPTTGSVHDATEWSIRVIGDPVRLTD